jgi:sugar lactone lactonase YvrE
MQDKLVSLPDGFKPEGIASDGANGFFVCSIRGWVWHHDLRTNSSRKVEGSEVHSTFLALTGLKFCPKQKALFLSSALNGKGYIFYLKKSKGTYSVKQRTTLQFPVGSYINDVVLGNETVFFTDSWLPRLYAVPRFTMNPTAGSHQPAITEYSLAQAMRSKLGLLASNGLAIVEDTPDSKVLVVAHWGSSALYRLQISKGSNVAKTERISFPDKVQGKRSGYDGIIMQGKNTLFVGDNLNNRVVRVQLSPDHRSANVTCVLASDSFDGTGTVTMQQGLLWVTNMRFTSCFLLDPCIKTPFAVVGVKVSDYCPSD